MTILTNTAAGGTVGTAATIANTGGASGDAFTSSDALSGLWEYSATAAHGGIGYRVQGTGTKAFFSWTGLSATQISTRHYIRFPAAPTVDVQIFTVRNSTAFMASLNLTTTRTIAVRSGDGVLLYTSPALAVDTWYRLEAAFEAGASATTGKVWFAYYALDSTTPVATMFTSTNANVGTTPFTSVNIGKLSTTGNYDAYIDSLKVDTATTALLGPNISAVATVRPAAVVTNGGTWANVGGAANMAAALADELDTSYATTGATPSNAEITFSLDGTLNTGPVVVKVRADIDTAVAGTIVVDLLQTSTVVATRTFSVTTTKQDFTFTTTTAETAAITSRSDLRLRITANQT